MSSPQLNAYAGPKVSQPNSSPLSLNSSQKTVQTPPPGGMPWQEEGCFSAGAMASSNFLNQIEGQADQIEGHPNPFPAPPSPSRHEEHAHEGVPVYSGSPASKAVVMARAEGELSAEEGKTPVLSPINLVNKSQHYHPRVQAHVPDEQARLARQHKVNASFFSRISNYLFGFLEKEEEWVDTPLVPPSFTRLSSPSTVASGCSEIGAKIVGNTIKWSAGIVLSPILLITAGLGSALNPTNPLAMPFVLVLGICLAGIGAASTVGSFIGGIVGSAFGIFGALGRALKIC